MVKLGCNFLLFFLDVKNLVVINGARQVKK